MSDARDRILAFLQKVDNVLQKYNKTITENDTYRTPFLAAMDDDFNTPLALGVIFKSVADGNKIVDKNNLNEKDKEILANIRLFIRDVAKNIFTLSLDYQAKNAAIDSMVSNREQARKNKDFKKADRIRDDLLEKGIIVEDTKEGSVWRKKL